MTQFSNCLQCGYDLTGLTEERCPECGQSFSLGEIQAINERYRTSIGGTMGKFLLIPMLFTVLGAGIGLVLERPYETAGLIGLASIGTVCAIYGIGQTVKLAKQFAWQRAIRSKGCRPIKQGMPFIITMVAGLVCCEAFLSVAGFCGGCVCTYINTKGLNIH